MAKKAKTQDTAGESAPANGNGPATLEAFLDTVYRDPHDAARSFRIGDLPIKSLARVFIKGANEILTDSGAFSKEQVAKLEAEGTLEAKKAESREKRWNSLLTGEFSVGVRGPKVSEAEREYRDVLESHFTTLHWNKIRAEGAKTSSGKPLPAWSSVKASKQTELLARWAAIPDITGKTGKTQGELAREEADRRIAERAAMKPAATVAMEIDLD